MAHCSPEGTAARTGGRLRQARSQVPPGPYTSRVVEFVLAAYLTMSALAFVLYAADKRRAVGGQWRISEAPLHTIELLGGWPGALVAQHLLHHKRRKTGYMRVFWVIVAIHGLAWWWVGG